MHEATMGNMRPSSTLTFALLGLIAFHAGEEALAMRPMGIAGSRARRGARVLMMGEEASIPPNMDIIPGFGTAATKASQMSTEVVPADLESFFNACPTAEAAIAADPKGGEYFEGTERAVSDVVARTVVRSMCKGTGLADPAFHTIFDAIVGNGGNYVSKARYSSCVDTWMAEATDVSTDRALVTVDFGDFQGDLQKAKAGVASAYAVLYGLIFGGAGLAAYYTYVMSQ
eukprot:CAMPEP_0182540292 /NCGR_PEP_ID=MMETSP1323-20130603/26818_1 /TAXON_ID=236787 /ORGANISM="Florenciella parvula, Strain RCC1693" /LENGTH=228 /DNA_ID=CAMNT_0024750937 /DNA_START=8 /DNA_END=694 /DNA_ORIENTATION=+